MIRKVSFIFGYVARICVMIVLLVSCVKNEIQTGNVIFIHPDGMGLSNWTATRVYYYGPDGYLHWDRLPYVGLYRGHIKNSLTASSQAGASIHAYGVKASYKAYGMEDGKQIQALSGNYKSIMQEAMDFGIKVGVVNSGSIVEPGTGVFLVSETARELSESIAEKIIFSGASVILSGGEEWLIPETINGRHGAKGKRTDGRNLINEIKDRGYTIIYSRDELLSVPVGEEKVLGVFSDGHTFNDGSEEELLRDGLPLYQTNSPTLAEMTEKAIEILSFGDNQFFLVVEEEGTDNLANKNNAIGTLTALKHADDAIGVASAFLNQNHNTLIITGSDSEAGGMELLGKRDDGNLSKIVRREWNGAPADGIRGDSSEMFWSKPDNNGNIFPFQINWSTNSDVSGGLISRANGLNANMLNANFDNTDIYRIMYKTLFGKDPDGLLSK
ncbi:MAG: alkaline phosphatase [Candidatus Neomarinimicrobiota bacterium]